MKYFQSQAIKLRICLGLGAQCPSPCTKGDGFISLELTNGLIYIVYRTFTGAVIFQGVLSKKAAKIKDLEHDESGTELSNIGL